jgi:hypothetical protein
MTDTNQTNSSWSTTQIAIVAILGGLVLALGVLQGIQFTQPDYKAQVRVQKRNLDTMAAEIEQLRQLNGRLVEQLGEELPIGFEVQIGAFEYYDIAASDAELVRMSRIENAGFNKYILGRFSYFEDAEAFLADVHQLGVQDAFIAGLVDGKRTSVEEAKKAAKDYYGY